jgi:glycyl-tRNA synthetase beta subunit
MWMSIFHIIYLFEILAFRLLNQSSPSVLLIYWAPPQIVCKYPRRLAVLVSDLQSQQEDQMIERKGPALSAPAQAVEGFAKSCGVDINALDKRELKGTDYYFFTQEKKGSKTQDLLENIVLAEIVDHSPTPLSALVWQRIQPHQKINSTH